MRLAMVVIHPRYEHQFLSVKGVKGARVGVFEWYGPPLYALPTDQPFTFFTHSTSNFCNMSPNPNLSHPSKREPPPSRI